MQNDPSHQASEKVLADQNKNNFENNMKESQL